MRRISFSLACLFACTLAFNVHAHGGGIDKCGGHKDKKKGGYHVHNMAKYCACNPTAAACKATPKQKPK
jgi:hypothetical protein